MAGATVTPVCTGYAQPVDHVRTLVQYGPHDPAGNPPDTITVKCAGRFPLCNTPSLHPRYGTHEVVLQVPPATLQLREQINTLAWIATNPEDDMAKQTAHEQNTYLSGYCNPTNPLWSHGRCSGSFRDKLCRCEMEGCHCNNARLERIAVATGCVPAVATTSWTADEVVDLMVELPECPLCSNAWDAHAFTDDDTVTCP